FTVGGPPAFPSDEATQELPGDSSATVMQPITSFSGIAIAATGTPHASVSPSDLNSFLTGHSIPAVESNISSRHLIMTSEDSTQFEQPSNSPLAEESHSSISKDTSSLSRTNSSSAISSISSTTLSPKILSSPSLSSDLTNLCGGLSLTTGSQELPTNFCAVRPFIVCSADDVNLQPGDIIATEEQHLEPDTREKFQSELAGEEKVTIFECGESSLIIDNRSVVEPCRGDKTDEPAADSRQEYLTVTPQHLAVSLDAELRSVSSDRSIKLAFIKQPEQQHRARYLTEGSRGAVKDQDGSGHPILEVQGTRRPCVVQVFVGSDSGRVTPHVYYQACQVASKSISDISERCIEGTTLIEVPVTPQMDMRLVCDCVGILKERCVDVEHRRKNKSNGGSSTSSGKSRKTTKCRLVFRAIVQLANGATEILQIASQPISCTQPPGVPEIIRKSISQCAVSDQPEMFIIGKHFQKDAKVVFEERRSTPGEKEGEDEEVVWSNSVTPDPEVLHLTHLICRVPQYGGPSTTNSSVEVSLRIVSGGKHSDAHSFTYTRE
ncbi:Rel domain (RHD) DNA-binding domain, partial [Trinorchestia longiramus]